MKKIFFLFLLTVATALAQNQLVPVVFSNQYTSATKYFLLHSIDSYAVAKLQVSCPAGDAVTVWLPVGDWKVNSPDAITSGTQVLTVGLDRQCGVSRSNAASLSATLTVYSTQLAQTIPEPFLTYAQQTEIFINGFVTMCLLLLGALMWSYVRRGADSSFGSQ